MNKQSSKVKRILSGALAVLFVGISAFAGGLANTREASAFSLSPMNKTVVLNPGESYRDTLSINNPSVNGEGDFYYKIVVKPYDVDENNNDIYDSYSDHNMIVDWITIANDQTGVVPPNESKRIEYVINVPETAPAGGQYAAITVMTDEEAASKDDSYGIRDNLAIAYLVYAEVTGNTIRQGEVTDVSIPGFLFSGNIEGDSSIKNTGNVHGRAKYTLQVFPLFSGEEVFTNEEDPEHELVLPGKTLYHKTLWDKTPEVGIFNVVYTVEFEGVTSQASKLVIKCPIWLLFIILFVIIMIIIWIVLKVRNRKKTRNQE